MRLKTLLLLFLLGHYHYGVAQYEFTIDAYILNETTKEAVPYANIGFIEKGIGTVSQENGNFFLQYDKNTIGDDEVLQISSIGYKTLTLTPKELYRLLEKDNKIYIEPDIVALDTTVVFAEKRKKMTIGADDYPRKIMGYWKEKEALGGEIATPIKIRKKNTKLENLKFYILENNSDSLLVRVNIYKTQKRKPGPNILTSNIFHTISKKVGEEVIDLSPYNIVVDDDVIVSLELIKVYGDEIGFAICGINNGRIFLKYISQDVWQQSSGVSIAYKMDVSYPLSSDKFKKRKKPEDIVLYWDTSLSRRDANERKELDFLKQYFKELQEAKVTFVPFSESIISAKTFDIKRGNINPLLLEINKQKHNGGTSFEDLFSDSLNPDQYLVFTDGHNTFGDHKFIYDTPVFYINSSVRANDNDLQEGGISSEGYYINLSKTSLSTAVKCILHDVEDRAIYNNDTTKEQVSGLVQTMDSIPIQGTNVSIKGTLVETETDANGKFTINAKPGEILVFRSFGMETKSMVLDATKDIIIALKAKYDPLDQVTIKAKKAPEIIEPTPLKLEKRKAGYAHYTMSREEVPKSAIFFYDVIRGRFPGVTVTGVGVNTSYSVRGAALRSPLFILDGVPLNVPPNLLLASQIENISVITSLSGTMKYGPQAAGGVFIITTDVGDKSKLEKIKDPERSLLVQGNDYNESPFMMSPNKGKPDYLNGLWESKTYAEAKEQYFLLREEYFNEIPFYIYTTEYFYRWDRQFSKQILSNLAELSSDNYNALRTLAFYLEERNEKEMALQTYEKIAALKPTYAQSYLDLARIYKENNRFKEAFELYKRIFENDDENIDFTQLIDQAESQLRHLLNNHRSEVPYTEMPEPFLVVKGVPARIVFEWSDPLAEFELQFVNPQKKYEKWTHVHKENPELLSSHVRSGVTSKEFFVDNSSMGEWSINIKSFDEASKLNPAFLKYTIYRNYGLNDETKAVKVVKLYNQQQKVVLDRFSL
ncbi:carboxypeptidase-like regulatory domain-containing protein [Aquimarina gracilis]|uniref:Carboxypeptidase-like regulatory domain-containing protein n=1 Tax=Aquimarina gracilis TaxID=874422 RepID=A0ABU6A138_9FLAO|nr:carboxypeptidase-like regulatory domain-containing protein [Aquimarina gracilis]MEB3347811.1 carboxypeptidase-like regulatory domain-containing protein [Aquimarina gracilis]